MENPNFGQKTSFFGLRHFGQSSRKRSYWLKLRISILLPKIWSGPARKIRIVEFLSYIFNFLSKIIKNFFYSLYREKYMDFVNKFYCIFGIRTSQKTFSWKCAKTIPGTVIYKKFLILKSNMGPNALSSHSLSIAPIIIFWQKF